MPRNEDFDSGVSSEGLAPYRPRQPSYQDVMLSDLVPNSSAPRDLFSAARFQANYLIRQSEHNAETARAVRYLGGELKALRKTIDNAIVTVADLAKKKAEDDAVKRHWAAVYAVVMPALAIAAGLFGSWWFAK